MIMDKRNISGDFSSWYKVSSYVKPKSPTQCDVRAKVFKLCCPQNIDHLLPVAFHLLYLQSYSLTISDFDWLQVIKIFKAQFYLNVK